METNQSNALRNLVYIGAAALSDENFHAIYLANGEPFWLHLVSRKEAERPQTGTADDVMTALQQQGLEVLKGKGGFWIRGEGHITLTQARKRTGITAPRRQRRERVAPYGDFATIAMLNGVRA